MKIVFKGSDISIKKGEILTLEKLDFTYLQITLRARKDDGRPQFLYYNSFEELSNDWEIIEDYEEPKLNYYIGNSGIVHQEKTNLDSEARESIGNRFETKEEAEKVVEKLKAWKRLKDKGFFFDGRTPVYDNTVKIRARVGVPFLTDELTNDLDLLFCTEVNNEG